MCQVHVSGLGLQKDRTVSGRGYTTFGILAYVGQGESLGWMGVHFFHQQQILAYVA